MQIHEAARGDALSAQYELARQTLARYFADESSAAAEPTRALTDAEAMQLGTVLSHLVMAASMLLQRDEMLASLADDEDAKERIAAIARRADGLRTAIAFRSEALRLQPKMIPLWTDALDTEMRRIVASSELVARAARDGSLPERTFLDVALQTIRFLPTGYGEIRETSNEVLNYCLEEDLVSHVVMVAGIIRQTFPNATGIALEVESDPESDNGWLTINLRVPEDGAFDHYKQYIAEVVRAIPGDALEKIRLCYDVR